MRVCPGLSMHTTAWVEAPLTLEFPRPPLASPAAAAPPPEGSKTPLPPPWTSLAPNLGELTPGPCNMNLHVKMLMMARLSTIGLSFSSLPSGQGIGTSELPSVAHQQVSIHGTLPRRKRGGTHLLQGNYAWDSRANPGSTSLSAEHTHQPATSTLVQNITDDFHGYR